MPEDVLTQVELADLRGAIDSWNPDLATISRKGASAGDDYGGYGNTGAYATIQSNVPITLESSPKNDQERTIYSLIGDTHAYFITFPALTDVRIDDKVVVTSQANLTLRVVSVIAPESWELERRVLATSLET
jgi:hypothetical protein